MTRKWLPFLLLALAALFFWRLWLAPDGFLYRPNSAYSDLTITHWPNALFIRHALAAWGQLPLWRPLILGGEPFAANPLSGLWYPPNLLLLVLPLSFAFNLLFVLHTAWAGWGAYRLARSVGSSPAGGLLAALAVMFAPKAVAHLAAGHVGLFFAWAWLPWVFWAVRRLAGRRRPADIATAAATAALLILADVRLGFYGGLAAGGYWVARAAWCVVRGAWSVVRGAWSVVLPALTAAALAGALVAAQALPLAAVAGRLNRGGLTLAESGIASLPPGYLVGLLVADHGGFQEWMTYLGAVVLLLAAVGLIRWRAGERWWWGALALAAAVYSLGTHTPLYGWLYRVLPALGWLRGPARAWFLVALATALLAAQGLTALEEGLPPRARRSQAHEKIRAPSCPSYPSWFRQRKRWADLAAVGLAAAGLVGGGAALVLRLPANVVFAAVIWPLSGLLIALRLGRRLRPAPFAALLLALALADLWAVGFTLYRVRPAAEVLDEGESAAAWLAAQPRPFRVYSPSYAIPQQTGAVYNLETVDGVDPFQLADFVAFARRATGVDLPGYSVTVPAFPELPAGEDMLLAHRDVLPDLQRLGLLNVRYLAATYPLEAEGLTPLGVRGGVYLYENTAALPRAFVVGSDFRSLEDFGSLSIVEWTANRIVVEAEGPGLLVLSEVYDPDWRATVDGQPAEVMRVEEILRGVRLEAGHHRVVFTYRPAGLSGGLALTAGGWLAVAALWWVGHRPACQPSSSGVHLFPTEAQRTQG